MKIVLQRVKEAKVEIEGKIKGQIGNGYLLLVGVVDEDTEEIADKMMEKISRLRLFQDGEGKTNLSISEVDGEVLIISQFTLCADCRKGNRPSFINAGNPVMAEKLYNHILDKSKDLFRNIECGEFGADMKVSLVNDGPFTLVLDSKEILK